MITPLAVICAIVAAVLFLLAVVVFRRSVALHDRTVAMMVEQGLHPCPHRPLDAIPCARPQGHSGPHLIRPSDIVHAGFYPAPF